MTVKIGELIALVSLSTAITAGANAECVDRRSTTHILFSAINDDSLRDEIWSKNTACIDIQYKSEQVTKQDLGTGIVGYQLTKSINDPVTHLYWPDLPWLHGQFFPIRKDCKPIGGDDRYVDEGNLVIKTVERFAVSVEQSENPRPLIFEAAPDELDFVPDEIADGIDDGEVCGVFDSSTHAGEAVIARVLSEDASIRILNESDGEQIGEITAALFEAALRAESERASLPLTWEQAGDEGPVFRQPPRSPLIQRIRARHQPASIVVVIERVSDPR